METPVNCSSIIRPCLIVSCSKVFPRTRCPPHSNIWIRGSLSWPHHKHWIDKCSLSQSFLRKSKPFQRFLMVPSNLLSKVLIQNAYELEPDDANTNEEEGQKYFDHFLKYRRTVYDHKAWAHHRDNLRHGRTILSMAGSKVVLALGPPVFGLTFISLVLACYNQAQVSHWLPLGFPLLHVSALPFQLLAPALALLLVFRTNASYARFDEARRAWGSNVTRTRDMARQALSWIQHPTDYERLRKLLHHCVAYSYCLKSHLLHEENLMDDLIALKLLDDNELETMLAAQHRPNYCLMMMSDIIHQCNVSEIEQALMSKNITQFFDNLGVCERIFKTPIPLSYTRLTSRFLVIWHIGLPLAMWDHCKWIVVPITCLSAAVLFCIEEVGVLIEEPFQIFPLEILCDLAHKNVESLFQIHEEYIIHNNKQLKHSDLDDDSGKEQSK